MSRTPSSVRRARAFTLLEVALIMGIIGMMLLIIIGYLMAPKPTGPLPPLSERPLIGSPVNTAIPAATTPEPVATPAAQTIEITPGAAPEFR